MRAILILVRQSCSLTPLGSARGVGVTEILISIVMLSIAVFGSLLVLERSSAENQRENTMLDAANLRSFIVETVISEMAWQNTTNDSSNRREMRCLTQGTRCPSSQTAFRLLDQGRRVLTDPGQPSLGFDRQLNLCQSFPLDPNELSDACPFRYDLRWRAICLNVPCSRQSVVVEGRLDYRGSTHHGVINPFYFNFVQMRDADFGQPVTLLTQALQAEGVCPNGDILSGFDSNGDKVCVSRLPCGSLDRVRSISAAGIIICRDGTTDRHPARGPRFLQWGPSWGWHCGTGTFDWRCLGRHWRDRCSPGGICRVEFEYGSGSRTLIAISQCSTFPDQPITSGSNFCSWSN